MMFVFNSVGDFYLFLMLSCLVACVGWIVVGLFGC